MFTWSQIENYMCACMYNLQLGIKKLNMNFYCQLLLVGKESDGVGGCDHVCRVIISMK